MTRTVPQPDHGTPARYLGTRTGSRPPCRCRPCTTAHTRACALRDLAHSKGLPPRVPAQPVTDHVHRLLAAHMSCTQISIAAGVSVASVANAASGKNPTFNRATAEKILAVRPRIVRDTDRLPTVGTRRRLQALYAIGHGALAISAASSLSPAGVQNIVYERVEHVTAATYKTVRAAYRQLVATPGTSTKAKASARAGNWPPPLAWGDDIDDPNAVPELGEGDLELGRDQLAALRRDEIEHLDGFGLPLDEIASRLNMATGYVRDILRELRTDMRRDRSKAAA